MIHRRVGGRDLLDHEALVQWMTWLVPDKTLLVELVRKHCKPAGRFTSGVVVYDGNEASATLQRVVAAAGEEGLPLAVPVRRGPRVKRLLSSANRNTPDVGACLP